MHAREADRVAAKVHPLAEKCNKIALPLFTGFCPCGREVTMPKAFVDRLIAFVVLACLAVAAAEMSLSPCSFGLVL